MSSNKNGWFYAFVAGPVLIGAAYGISSLLIGGRIGRRDGCHRYDCRIRVITLGRRAYSVGGCFATTCRYSQGGHEILGKPCHRGW